MTLEELAQKATAAINAANGEYEPSIILSMYPGRSENRRLLDSKSPMGKVIGRRPGVDTVRFSAVDVLAWLVAVGAVEEVATQ